MRALEKQRLELAEDVVDHLCFPGEALGNAFVKRRLPLDDVGDEVGKLDQRRLL